MTIPGNLNDLARAANDLQAVSGGLNAVAADQETQSGRVEGIRDQLTEAGNALGQIVGPGVGIEVVTAGMESGRARVAEAVGHVGGHLRPATKEARDLLHPHSTGIQPLREAVGSLALANPQEGVIISTGYGFNQAMAEESGLLNGIRDRVGLQLLKVVSIIEGIEAARQELLNGRQRLEEARDHTGTAAQRIAEYVIARRDGA